MIIFSTSGQAEGNCNLITPTTSTCARLTPLPFTLYLGRFVYRKHGETKKASRLVHPYHLAYVNNLWLLFARDPKAKTPDVVRKFVLVRLSRPEVTGDVFVPRPFDLNKELSGSLGVFKGQDNYEVVIEFDAWGADDVRVRRWHASQELTELWDGSDGLDEPDGRGWAQCWEEGCG